MDTVIRYVREMESGQRLWLESEIGHELRDDQRIMIHVFAPGEAAIAEPRQLALPA